MIHQRAKTLLESEFVMGPHILQKRYFFFHSLGGKKNQNVKENLRVPSALFVNSLEAEG